MADPAWDGERDKALALVLDLWREALGTPGEPGDDFFEEGGNSVLAVETVMRLQELTGAELPPDAVHLHRTPERLAALLAGDAGGDRAPIGVEERLLVAERLHPDTPLYSVPVRYRITGQPDLAALRTALRVLTDAHPALRSRFTPEGRVVTEPAAEWPVRVVLANADGEDCAPEIVRRTLAQETGRPIPHDEAPLARACVIRESAESWTLLLNLHHLVADGISLDLIDAGLQEAYARATGRPASAPPRPRTGMRLPDAGPAGLSFWTGLLAGVPQPLALPHDRARPAVRSVAGAVDERRLDGRLEQELARFSRDWSLGEHTVLLAALAAWASTETGPDTVIAVPLAGRRPEDEGTVGMFVNTVPLRFRTDGATRFTDLCTEASTLTARALAHQTVPLQEIVAALGLSGETGFTPLTQLAFSHVDHRRWRWFAGQGPADREVLTTGTAKFELLWTVTRHPAHSVAQLEYSTDLFTPERAARVHEGLLGALERLLARPDLPIPEALGSGGAEGNTVRAGTSLPAAPPGETVHERVLHHAAATPDAVAVRADRHLTYRELGQASSALAARLLSAGVRPGDRVAVVAPRGAAAVAAFLAVLRTGAAYVPVDVGQPEERSRTILADCAVRHALVDPGCHAHVGSGVTPVPLPPDVTGADEGEFTGPRVTPEHVAYVMYTSGSTGRPKGVMIPHRAINRLVPSSDFHSFTSEDVVAHVSNIAFDAATFEIWGALTSGATLAVLPHGPVTPAGLRDFLAGRRVSVLFITAAMLTVTAELEPRAFSGLRTLLFGGEQHSVSALRTLWPHLPRAVNAYGPTENTTFGVTHPLTEDDLRRGLVPIGTALTGDQALVLDEEFCPLPPGRTGELYLSGPGLAHGYWADPARTAERFLPHPGPDAPAGARLYRTGDLAHQTTEGHIVYVGRADQQIKIRGFRVEPGEVESVLDAHPGVREGAVLVTGEEGERKIVAVYTGPADPADVRGHLALKLPSYMLPARCLVLGAMPLNANGKTDRTALRGRVAELLAAERAADTEGEAVANDILRSLAAIWREVLGPVELDAASHFFRVGGHSIHAMRVVALIQQRFGVRVHLAAFFAHPTLGQMGAFLSIAPEKETV
ncbi:amino acid adenylation domain-containing protein [Streptomyces sp. JH002]|uniref:non-ribosomal peptide synthetase n=1 Tax=Streptomyces sp. JH002 TaxID=2763259 RepID=UPI003D806836